MIEHTKVELGRPSDINSWMRLVRKVSWNFPGLETEQSIEEHKRIVLKFMNDNNHHLIVCEVDGKIVASCVCVVIPNLTRNVRPYAFVENVVTHADYRKKGYATDCLNYAKHIAKENNCYKMMLLTGSKEESTLNFYRNAGYNSTDKTAFIQWIDM